MHLLNIILSAPGLECWQWWQQLHSLRIHSVNNSSKNLNPSIWMTLNHRHRTIKFLIFFLCTFLNPVCVKSSLISSLTYIHVNPVKKNKMLQNTFLIFRKTFDRVKKYATRTGDRLPCFFQAATYKRHKSLTFSYYCTYSGFNLINLYLQQVLWPQRQKGYLSL